MSYLACMFKIGRKLADNKIIHFLKHNEIMNINNRVSRLFMGKNIVYGNYCKRALSLIGPRKIWRVGVFVKHAFDIPMHTDSLGINITLKWCLHMFNGWIDEYYLGLYLSLDLNTYSLCHWALPKYHRKGYRKDNKVKKTWAKMFGPVRPIIS